MKGYSSSVKVYYSYQMFGFMSVLRFQYNLIFLFLTLHWKIFNETKVALVQDILIIIGDLISRRTFYYTSDKENFSVNRYCLN